jgi:5-methylcytosine-specific restriction endonuclease McrA
VTREYRRYLRSEHWQLTRKAMLKRWPTCELCRKRKATQVHHIHYESLWNEVPDDLQSVCGECHGWEHRVRPVKRSVEVDTSSAFP